MSEDYKVLIGAEAKESEFDAIEARIKNLTKPNSIKLQIDPNVTKQIGQLEKALERAYGNNFKLDLDLNVDEITAVRKGLVGLGNTIESISRVFNALERSTASLSGLDGLFTGSLKGLGNVNANLNDLKSTFNDIENAIERTISSIDQLKKKTNSFTPSFDLGIKRSASEKNALIESMSTDLMPDLQDQAKKLMEKLNIRDVFDADAFAGKYFKGSVVQYTTRFREAYREAVQGMHQLSKGERQATSVEQAGAYRNLINQLREYATVSGANVSSLDSEFASISDRLKELDNVASGADIDKRLKEIFTPDINVSEITDGIREIVQGIKELKQVVDSFSKTGINLDGFNDTLVSVKTSLDSIDKSLEKITSKSKLLFSGGSNFNDNNAINSIANKSDEVTSTIIQNEEKKQAAYKATADSVVYHAGHMIDRINDGQISSSRSFLESLGLDEASIDIVMSDLSRIVAKVKEIKQTFTNDGQLKLNVKGVTDDGKDVDITRGYKWGKSESGDKILEPYGKISIKQKFTEEVDETEKLLKEAENKVKVKAEEIADIEIELDKLKINEGSIAEIERLTEHLERLKEEYRLLNQDLSNPQTSGDITLPDDVQKRIEEGKVYNRKVYEENIASQAEKISKGFANRKFEVDFESIKTDLNSLSNATDETKQSVSALENAYKALDNAIDIGDNNQIIKAKEVYDNAKQEAQNAIRANKIVDDQIKAQQKAKNDTAKLDVNKRAFESGMDVWLNKNSEAADYFADKIANIRQRLKECDATELTQLRTEFTDLKRQAELAGKTVKSFGDRLSDQFKRFGTYFALDNIIDEAVQGIRDMYDQVVQIDTAMTDLYKVTDETPERYEQFLGSAQKGAKELGRSVSSYITQSAKWAQMGYGIGDSEQLAKISSIYSNVADVDDATAVSDIISNLKAFGIQASEAVRIVDVLNHLSNNYATTAAGLGQGLSNSASAMAMSNATFEQTAALLTGITEITQSPSEAGSFLKVASMRIRGLRTFKPITYENMYLLSSINNKVA